MELTAGNEPPVVAFDIGKNNKSFYFPDKTYNYNVKVKDKEDGSTDNGKIKPSAIVVNIDYLSEGFDKTEIVQGHRTAEEATVNTRGMKMIQHWIAKPVMQNTRNQSVLLSSRFP